MYQTLDNSINPVSQSEKYSLMDPGTHNNMEPNYGSKGPYLPNLSNVEKFQQLQGIYDDTYAKPKTEVLNTNQYTWVPQAINNTIEYPRDNMYERALDTMYLRNNVKPFETELVGAADDPLLFRPLPKVGGELYVNPKSELKYTSIAPGGSAIENPTCSPNVAKNKVPTAFKNPAPNGFTTTGAVQGALTHGEINLGYQNRQDTNPEYTVPGNTMNARTSVVTGPLRDVRKKFTSKNDYTYAPNPAYGVASTMNKDSIHTMKTDLEKLQNTVGQRPYNNGINVPATTRTDLVHQMNTQLEQDQLNAGQNIVNSAINTPATMNNKQVYGMKTQLEKDQLQAGSRAANTSVEIPMTMRNKDNYLMKSRLEKDQLKVGSRAANTGVEIPMIMRNKDNYTMKTRLEKDQLKVGSRTANTDVNVSSTIRNKDNYTMKTRLEQDQLHVGSRTANTGVNVSSTIRNKDNYTMKTQLEKDQLHVGSRTANTGVNVSSTIRNKDNYTMKTRLEQDQLRTGSRTANTGVNVSSTIRNKDNYMMKTRLEQDQLRAGSRTANMSSNVPTTMRNKDNYTMKTQLEKDQLHAGSRPANTSSNVPTTMRNKDNYTMKTQLEKDQLNAGARQANTSSTIPERIRNFLAMTFDKVKETLSPEYYASGTGPTAQRSRSQFVTTGNKFETINPERMGGCNDRFNPNINVKCDRNNLQIRRTNPSASYDQSVVERVPINYRFRDTDSVSISINNRLDPGITKPLVDNPYITTNLSIM